MSTKLVICVGPGDQASILNARLKFIPWILSHIRPDYVIRSDHYRLSHSEECYNDNSKMPLHFPVDRTIVCALGFVISEYQGILLQGGNPWFLGRIKGYGAHSQIITRQEDQDILKDLRKSLRIFVKDQIGKCDEEVQDILCRLHALDLNTPGSCDTSQMQSLQGTLLKLTRLMPLVRPMDKESQLSKMKVLEEDVESLRKRLATQRELLDVASVTRIKLIQQLDSTKSEKQELEDQLKLILIKGTEGPGTIVNDRILTAISMRTSSILAESNTRWTKYG